jgi:ATP-dependent Clp protease ATP-binding subunit ClpA
VLELENFSSRARSSINRATAESHWLGHNFVGLEQLLLGMLGADEALVQLIGVSLESVRAEVERTIGRGAGYVSANSAFTPRARQILQTAISIKSFCNTTRSLARPHQRIVRLLGNYLLCIRNRLGLQAH